MKAPGRHCPLHYRYSPAALSLSRAADVHAETLYVIGGLYGNQPALETILALCEREAGAVTLVFNGDFNWFNVDPAGFTAVNEIVLSHVALRGNVETELGSMEDDAGCGCAYPEGVDDGVVERSNAIMQRLKDTARAFPQWREPLLALPMYRVAQIGGLRIGIVHGDAESLAGWRFSWESLADPEQLPWLQEVFRQARVRIFACTHTCLPAVKTVELAGGAGGMVVNNGAAGMPNFRDGLFGLITRISSRPARGVEVLYGSCLDGVHVDALPVRYDQAAWERAFLSNWPVGSAAYESYYRRIVEGPDFAVGQAVQANRHRV